MSSSSNEAAPGRALTPRLAAALAAGAALCALLVVGALVAQSRAEATRALPRYYRTTELDVVPGIKTRVEPEYPPAAAARHLSGRVVIRLYIDESGAVVRVSTLRAEPPGYFETSAERAFLAARFTPGMKGGVAVRTQLTLEVDFSHPPPAQQQQQ